jgi:iron(III) transport system ATP-binding protein
VRTGAQVANALHCHAVSKRFGELWAVREAHLEVTAGQFMALLGPSGCGKTTLLRLIAGFEPIDGGQITIGGRLVASERGSGVPPEQRRVGMVFQDYALFPHLSVAANIAYGLQRNAERQARVQEMLALVGLSGLGERMPHQLSGGQQQRVALARALAPRPALLLLDEPFSNLDASLRRSVRTEVREILRQAGATVLFVTHDQEEALSIADSVAVMLAGQVAQVADPRTLYLRPVNRGVAAFVGEACFLPGEAVGQMASTVLGELPLAIAARGPVELLLRPEQIVPIATNHGQHTIVERHFYGHSQRYTIRLADGTLLQARCSPWLELNVGEKVEVRIEGEVVGIRD